MTAAMELGGTKTVLTIGESDGTLEEAYRYSTTTPKSRNHDRRSAFKFV